MVPSKIYQDASSSASPGSLRVHGWSRPDSVDSLMPSGHHTFVGCLGDSATVSTST